MWIKMSAVGRLISGRLTEPVAMRRVHDNNRIFASKQENEYYRFLLLKTLFEWSVKCKLNPQKVKAIAEQYIPLILVREMLYKKRLTRKKYQFKSFLQLVFKYPFTLRYYDFWKSLFLIFGIKI
jgi:Flp pilus assembly protein TadB